MSASSIARSSSSVGNRNFFARGYETPGACTLYTNKSVVPMGRDILGTYTTLDRCARVASPDSRRISLAPVSNGILRAVGMIRCASIQHNGRILCLGAIRRSRQDTHISYV